MRIVITGASGKAGQATLRHFAELPHYDVLGTDLAPRPAWYAGDFLRADLAEYGEAVDVLSGADAVVHHANNPRRRDLHRLLDVPTREALAVTHPGITVPDHVSEFGTLLSNSAAKDALGFAPQHSWRHEVHG
ncbi:NAD-dependent epimerase/dehydratase family protein [Tessaracoccus flavus]|uniref:Uncharacterized protein n=1 Tax=Tessaracoccus flavus TaxID=1610493 RepID=A0A1Q2CG25_9ACTN|nr:NAD-dependent epimerase/dehydratase family protein [Tessaracoccus flavus]AQP45069.1 hypothetical protein RPIT_09935 [Tessaracoccus flavus]SDY57413.1 hypothetical protein SAMN05428934_102319 [Tessaracoccus flavus]